MEAGPFEQILLQMALRSGADRPTTARRQRRGRRRGAGVSGAGVSETSLRAARESVGPGSAARACGAEPAAIANRKRRTIKESNLIVRRRPGPLRGHGSLRHVALSRRGVRGARHTMRVLSRSARIGRNLPGAVD